MPAAGRPAEARAPLERSAWAKVNLYLHLLGKRADGYHELDSLIVFAAVGDRLRFAPAGRLSLQVEGPFAPQIPNDRDNLVMRAAMALKKRYGISDGAAITLNKQLPVAAGIGGGSSDAAAALRGLTQLWGLAADERELLEIAVRLGADVPICLYGRPAFVGGIGERIDRAPALPPGWLVLVNPGRTLATPEVFKARRGDFSQAARWQEVDRDCGAFAARLAERGNDLEAAARSLIPEISEILDQLRQQDGCLLARMSGSGATSFGLFGEATSAGRAAAALRSAQPRWWTAVAALLHGPLDMI